MLKLSLYTTAASVALVLAAGPAFAIKPNSTSTGPGNSGINLEQTRLSNAGAGNGGEFVQSGDPETVVTTRTETTIQTSDPYEVVTGSGDLPTVVEAGPWTVSGPGAPVGNSGNIKYTLTRTVTTTTGTYTETTTYVDTTTTSQNYEDTTVTTTYVDVDPGKSQAHNQAPEVDGDVQSDTTSQSVGEPTSSTTSEATGTETTNDTSASTSTEDRNFVDNKPHDVGDVVPD